MFWLTVLEPRVLVDGLGAVAAVVCRYCAAHLDLLDVAIGSRASYVQVPDAPTMLRVPFLPMFTPVPFLPMFTPVPFLPMRRPCCAQKLTPVPFLPMRRPCCAQKLAPSRSD